MTKKPPQTTVGGVDGVVRLFVNTYEEEEEQQQWQWR